MSIEKYGLGLAGRRSRCLTLTRLRYRRYDAPVLGSHPSNRNVAVFAGTFVSFAIAAVLAVWYPALESRPVWVFSITTFIVFLVLDFLLGVGATTGQGILISILVIRAVALGVAYLLAFAGGYARATQWRSAEQPDGRFPTHHRCRYPIDFALGHQEQ